MSIKSDHIPNSAAKNFGAEEFEASLIQETYEDVIATGTRKWVQNSSLKLVRVNGNDDMRLGTSLQIFCESQQPRSVRSETITTNELVSDLPSICVCV